MEWAYSLWGVNGGGPMSRVDFENEYANVTCLFRIYPMSHVKLGKTYVACHNLFKQISSVFFHSFLLTISYMKSSSDSTVVMIMSFHSYYIVIFNMI